MVFVKLKKRSDFVALRQGAKVVKPVFMLSARLTDNEPSCCRIGFTVTKKISRKATERNLIKRRLRHIVQQSSLIRGEMPSMNCVVIARQGILQANFLTLQYDFELALKRLLVILEKQQKFYVKHSV